MEDKIEVICKGCKRIILEGSLKTIKNCIGKDKYVECPYCGHQAENPFFGGEEDEKI